MTQPFSKDLREAVVTAYTNGVGTITEVAQIFSISKSSVNKYLYIARNDGDLTPKTPTGRPPLLTEENLQIIKEIILSSPSERLVDYCEKFEEQTGIAISKSCLWVACQILNIKRKKKVFLLQSKND